MTCGWSAQPEVSKSRHTADLRRGNRPPDTRVVAVDEPVDREHPRQAQALDHEAVGVVRVDGAGAKLEKVALNLPSVHSYGSSEDSPPGTRKTVDGHVALSSGRPGPAAPVGRDDVDLEVFETREGR
jgi:hypothetical protein